MSDFQTFFPQIFRKNSSISWRSIEGTSSYPISRVKQAQVTGVLLYVERLNLQNSEYYITQNRNNIFSESKLVKLSSSVFIQITVCNIIYRYK